MTATKAVDEVDEYAYSGTEYVLIATRDGWLYRFQRPEGGEVYCFDLRQRPDGTRDNVRRDQTPAPVVDYMREHYDCAQLHPEKRRATGWSG